MTQVMIGADIVVVPYLDIINGDIGVVDNLIDYDEWYGGVLDFFKEEFEKRMPCDNYASKEEYNTTWMRELAGFLIQKADEIENS